MAQPKKKTSKSKRDMRRAHWYKMDLPNMVACADCGTMIPAHQACPACGTYKGRQVIIIKTPKTKKEKAEAKENTAKKPLPQNKKPRKEKKI